VCFVLVGDDECVPIGYYTLAATGTALAELPEPFAKLRTEIAKLFS
jgi:hypothetical protein